MSQTIKKIKGKEYLYESVWNPETKKTEYKCLGNVKNLPKVDDSKVTLSFPTKHEFEETNFFRAMECGKIDEAFVQLVIEANNSTLEYINTSKTDPLLVESYKAQVALFNHIIMIEGVPSALVECLQEMLVRWRKKSPVYADNNKLEIVPEIPV
jgi:hypothetical protein